MTRSSQTSPPTRAARYRFLLWGGAALLLLVPLVAMQFSDEVKWDLTDFIVFGAMLAGACGGFEIATRSTRDLAFQAAVGVALAAAFLLVWSNLAVGFIGDENNPANVMLFGVPLIAMVGAAIARLRARPMAAAMLVTAFAQAMVAVIAALGFGVAWSEVAIQSALLVGMWLVSAWLFALAARGRGRSG